MYPDRQITKIYLLILAASIFLGDINCTESAEIDHVEYYKDFSIFDFEGIGKLNPKFAKDENFYFQVYSRGAKIYLINVVNQDYNQIANIQVFPTDVGYVFDIRYNDVTYGELKKCLKFNKNEATSYFFAIPVVYPDETTDIFVDSIKKNYSVKIMEKLNCVDTINFVKKLQRNRSMPIQDPQEGKHYSLQYNQEFTLSKYLGLERGN